MKNIFAIALLLLTQTAFAQSDDARKKNFNIKKNVAIEGYDPVSYFDGKPAEGDSKFNASFKGVTYLFSNASNANRFKGSPEKYEPAYGGWCAYAMGANGEKVKIDPETYKIADGKLYLFYNFWGNNTLKEWNKNEKTLKSNADQNWKKFIP
jgi:YHS domain-containing protein